MRHRIPVGTEIYPFSSDSGEIGPGRQTTVEVVFSDGEIMKTLSRPDPAGGPEARFYQLSLGENPSQYDAYLVRTQDVEVARD